MHICKLKRISYSNMHNAQQIDVQYYFLHNIWNMSMRFCKYETMKFAYNNPYYEPRWLLRNRK